MERRAKPSNEEETMIVAHAKRAGCRAEDGLIEEVPSSNASLMELILTRENLQRAWNRVKANRGSSGEDEMNIEDFPAFIRSPQWAQVKESLQKGT
jgi:hypothetical protein